MTQHGNLGARASATDLEDITIDELLAALGNAADLPLVFSYDGRDVKPGYHVTEIKTGRFEGLDCGGQPESWTEIFVQIWDVNPDRGPMLAGKFAKIVAQVARHLDLDRGARLTFEVSDGIRPMQLHRAALPRIEGRQVRIGLSPRPASCKPVDRWGLQGNGCRTSSQNQPCCG